jgi:hypothetical protein
MVLVSKHEMFKSNLASLLRQKERHFLEFDQFFYKIWTPKKKNLVGLFLFFRIL